MQPGEPSHGITSSYDAPRSVWFEWTCPTSGDYDVEHDLSGSTGMGIYIGEQFGLLNLIARDSSELRFRAIAGLTYRIAVAKAGTPGRFNLSIQRVSRPSNDDFANRLDLGSALHRLLWTGTGIDGGWRGVWQSQAGSVG